MKSIIFVLLILCVASVNQGDAHETDAYGHRVLTNGNGRLAIVGVDGQVEWEYPASALHDLQMLSNGNILYQQNSVNLIERTPEGRIAWQYTVVPEQEGQRIEVHAFQRLPDGNTFIAVSGLRKILEVDPSGRLVHEIELSVNQPSPHRDTRLVRRLDHGGYLVCHEGDGFVREYARDGEIIWEYEVPLFGKPPKKGHGPEAFGNHLFSALRLPNGNTLIGTGDGHSVLEVTPDEKIVWKIEQNDLPGITLAWVTTLEVLPNGNIVIGNCHAGPDNPLLVEVDHDKNVVWTFDHFETFGNSVSNSQILDIQGAIR